MIGQVSCFCLPPGVGREMDDGLEVLAEVSVAVRVLTLAGLCQYGGAAVEDVTLRLFQHAASVS